MRNILRVIDSVNERVGSVSRWFVVALLAVTVYDVTARYLFNAPTVWGYEASIMLGGTIFILAGGYVQLHQAHARVDVIYTHLSARRKAIIDVLGTAIIFFPMYVGIIKVAVVLMWKAWLGNEVMTESFWYPPAAPFRTMIVIGCCLLFLQYIAQFIRDLYVLRKGRPYD